MKKWILPLFLTVASISAFAAAELSSQLNVVLTQILAPYQNQNTQAQLEFSTVEVNTNSTRVAELHGNFRKSGPNNTVNLVLNSLRYAADSGSGTPATSFRATLDLDVLKLVDQGMINDLVPGLPDMIASLVADYAGDLKDALVVNTTITRTFQDADGNYQEVKGRINLTVDFSKLPNGMGPEEMPITRAYVDFDFVVAQGLRVEGVAISNLGYKGFRTGELGLKELFERLLSRDQNALAKVDQFLKQANDYAKQLTGSEI